MSTVTFHCETGQALEPVNAEDLMRILRWCEKQYCDRRLYSFERVLCGQPSELRTDLPPLPQRAAFLTTIDPTCKVALSVATPETPE